MQTLNPPPASPPPLPSELVAPPSWRQVTFISDLHLQHDAPHTHQAWVTWMESLAPSSSVAPESVGSARHCDALFILGDLFEVWIGDDLVNDTTSESGRFAAACLQTIHEVATRLPVYFIAGNRDFLLGAHAAQAAKMTRLADPTALHWANETYLLSHGDAWCLADEPYMQFREMVRSEAWQSQFLAHALASRQQLAKGMRDASQERQLEQHDQGMAWADLDSPTVIRLLQDHHASLMVHGHTHRPGLHHLDAERRRLVLSDWDLDQIHGAARAEILTLDRQGQITRHPLPGSLAKNAKG